MITIQNDHKHQELFWLSQEKDEKFNTVYTTDLTSYQFKI